MEDPEQQCFYTTFTVEAGNTFGFEVTWGDHPIIPRRNVLVITKIKRGCRFGADALSVGDIITHLDDQQVTNPQVFKRRVQQITTFKKLLLDDVEEEAPQQPVQPAPVVTDKTSDTNRKRQHDELKENEEDELNEEQPEESSPIDEPNVLQYRTPPSPLFQEGFNTPAANVPVEPPPLPNRIKRCGGITKDLLRAYDCDDHNHNEDDIMAISISSAFSVDSDFKFDGEIFEDDPRTMNMNTTPCPSCLYGDLEDTFGDKEERSKDKEGSSSTKTGGCRCCLEVIRRNDSKNEEKNTHSDSEPAFVTVDNNSKSKDSSWMRNYIYLKVSFLSQLY